MRHVVTGLGRTYAFAIAYPSASCGCGVCCRDAGCICETVHGGADHTTAADAATLVGAEMCEFASILVKYLVVSPSIHSKQQAFDGLAGDCCSSGSSSQWY
jgi:hypothetical protein